MEQKKSAHGLLTLSRRLKFNMKRVFFSFTLLLLTIGAKAQNQQEWRDSVSSLSAMIERYPSNILLRLRKAAFNIELGQWKYALDEYSNVLALDPNNLTALYYRGFVNQHLGRYSFARQDYECILKMEPLDIHALMGLILTNLADNHITQAFDDANRLVNISPDNAEALATRAEVESQLKMTEAAIEDIEKAIEIEDVKVQQKYPTSIDDNITSYQLMAFSLYIKQGNKHKAVKSLEYLIKNGLPKAYLEDYYTQLEKKK